MNKLKDVAGLLKAKITKDQLQEALINATSEENWQASTHILHQIANAAYNYEKCQQINQFIWDKLKKGKSWRKILKTLSLVQFLLKNGPPSIINSYKYDIYQFRSFDSYSNYQEGIDRGQSIREKAKVVVELLNNEELLQQERVKAKTIRQKMSGVVGGSNYGGHSSSQNKMGAKYGSIDNKSYSTGGYTSGGSGTDYGGLGTYGDYSYNKSTLDKYKDSNNKQKDNKNQNKIASNTNIKTNNQEKTETVVESKQPFARIAPKLVKPGSKPVSQKQQVQGPKSGANKNTGGDLLIDDILGGEQPQVTQKVNQNTQEKVQAPQNTLPFSFETPSVNVPPVQQHQGLVQNNVFSMQQQPLINQAPINQQLQPQPNLYQQPQINQFYGQQQQPLNNSFNLMQQPNLYGQSFNQGYGQQQHQMSGLNYTNSPNMNFGGQQPGYQQANLYGGYPQPNMNQMHNLTNPSLSLNSNQNWNNSKPVQQNPNNNLLGNITLATTSTNKKQQDQFGNFSSGQNNNVKWLSNQQKGLIDFSDFGQEIKKDNKKNNNQNENQIDTTWAW